MHRLLPALSFLLIGLLSAPAQQPAKPKPAPNPSLAPIQDVAGLPRVLLIGDSISMGYTLDVRELLKGKANVHRIPTNGGPTTNGLKNIKAWRDVWSAGHGVGSVHAIQPASALVATLRQQYQTATAG